MTYKLVVASQKDKLEDTFLYKSLVTHGINPNNVLFFGNNKQPLPVIYNEALDICKTKLVIFTHDDVYINCGDFEKRIRYYSDMYDVFGLAGNTQITVKEPVLWHLMTERQNLRGCVAHGMDENNYMYTSFGPVPSRVLMIDGVFMAVNMPCNVKFDESNPAHFHFYDLMFSLDCNLAKVKVGVGDIPIIHNSPGLSNVSEQWKQGQKYFLTKYNKYLNKTLTV
jgi:hypothetical protein